MELKSEEMREGCEETSCIICAETFVEDWIQCRILKAGLTKIAPILKKTTCLLNVRKPSAENTELWWKSVLSNKLSRIKIAKLVSFLTENENLIKQPPDATSSSDSEPDFSPSPRPKTLISPPTSI
ncbi:hypothetical protein AVEN_213127-1 [Araneus ventricosus]|uniref:Uncharacterized protein n=1 Tax=Araneus ventricosus TaxID=182803 RepID=A0A4Y2MYV1_ARAVE|nr:hypothetical protein AVEN_213127-1 [Araneus ventricosus]